MPTLFDEKREELLISLYLRCNVTCRAVQQSQLAKEGSVDGFPRRETYHMFPLVMVSGPQYCSCGNLGLINWRRR